MSKRLALFVLCTLAAPAAAEINMADSVEWQTIDSDVVVRGFVTSANKTGDAYDVTFQITETIKGGVKQSLQLQTTADPARWRKDKTDLLLFLDKDRSKYVLRPQNGASESVFELGKHRAYTSAFDVLDKPTDVLAAARTAARSTATASHRLDVPWDTPAMKALYGGSTVWMTVPVDAALEKLAQRWIAAPDVSTREEGTNALANFRSDGNIEIMKKLLADPGFAEVSTTGQPTVKRYLVRAAAHAALAKWHVPHASPTIDEPLKK